MVERSGKFVRSITCIPQPPLAKKESEMGAVRNGHLLHSSAVHKDQDPGLCASCMLTRGRVQGATGARVCMRTWGSRRREGKA